MKAVRCPLCDGEGIRTKLKRNFPITTDKAMFENYKIRCNGCNGKGWVEVSS